jgi:chromosome segregation ATPase
VNQPTAANRRQPTPTNRHHPQGVYGSLADLLEVPPQLSTAVEVVCGNQAFQVGGADSVLHSP